MINFEISKKYIKFNEKDVAYYMLYKFLARYRILDHYIYNLIASGKNKADVKTMLKNVVERHSQSGYGNDYTNLFNYAVSTFYWDDSIEGRDFWDGYYVKWLKFQQDFKKKYKDISL